MPDLGTRHECYSCGAKFYDLGKAEALCPKCGANQKDGKTRAPAAVPSAARRRRKDELARRSEDDAGSAEHAEAEPADADEEVVDSPEVEAEAEDDFDEE
jgi:uncharacterized protein (TIGR02300 family)